MYFPVATWRIRTSVSHSISAEVFFVWYSNWKTDLAERFLSEVITESLFLRRYKLCLTGIAFSSTTGVGVEASVFDLEKGLREGLAVVVWLGVSGGRSGVDWGVRCTVSGMGREREVLLLVKGTVKRIQEVMKQAISTRDAARIRRLKAWHGHSFRRVR